MEKSAVFFDIDGTLWDYEHNIPESTVRAIKKLRENGHYAFICSGRTRSTIRAKELSVLGFDGIVAGCGTYIEKNGEILKNDLVTYEQIMTMKKMFKDNKIGAFYEGCDKLYIDWDFFKGEGYAESFEAVLGDDCVGDNELNEASRVNKFSVDYRDCDEAVMVANIPDCFDPIIHDFRDDSGKQTQFICEIVPKGYSKATGIEWICDYLGVDHKNTYAFGDGANDVTMLKYVACGIAMGSGTKSAKEAADMVTKGLFEDGIEYALKELGLI